MVAVSVLITSYNRKDLIRETIESVLASDFKDFEVIVVDDCSTDGSYEVVQEYAQKDNRVRAYRNEKNLGDYPNRNRAASYAVGRYIKYVDSDDLLYPYSLGIMVDMMDKNPEAGFGLSSYPDEKKPYPVLISQHQAYMEHFYQYGHFDRAPGSAIIRRDCFNAIGGFTGDRMIGDTQLWFALGRTYPMLKIPRDLVWVRDHPARESNDDYAKLYSKLTAETIANAFAHPQCPLSEGERVAVLKHMKKVNKVTEFRKITRRIRSIYYRR